MSLCADLWWPPTVGKAASTSFPGALPCHPTCQGVRSKGWAVAPAGKSLRAQLPGSHTPLLLLSCLCPTRGSCAATLHTVGAKVSAFSTRFFINIFSFFLSTVSLATSISQYALRWICLTTHVYIFLNHFFSLNCGADGVFGTYPAINPHLTNEETEI